MKDEETFYVGDAITFPDWDTCIYVIHKHEGDKYFISNEAIGFWTKMPYCFAYGKLYTSSMREE